jgi:hypothetical protein
MRRKPQGGLIGLFPSGSQLPPINAGADGGGIGHLVLDRLELLFKLLQSGIVHPAPGRDSLFPKGVPNPEKLSCDVLIGHANPMKK